MSVMKNKLTIVVTTSYMYRTLIDGFTFFFEKNWANCPYDVVISLESEYKYSERFKFFTSTSSDWSTRLWETLDSIDSDYVLLLMDDYFIFDIVSNNEISKILDFVIQNRISHLSHSHTFAHFNIGNRCNVLINNYEVVEVYSILSNFAYVLISADFYNRKFLMEILRKNETAWDFENMASFRTIFLNDKSIYKLIGDEHPLKYTIGGVIHKGKIRNGVQDIMDKNNFLLVWNDKKNLSVSTYTTPFWIRFSRKIIRITKYLNHVFFKKIRY